MRTLITLQQRSEKGYGFERPGLKTGVEMVCFGLKWGQDLENRAAHPYREFRVVPPAGGEGGVCDQVNNIKLFYWFTFCHEQGKLYVLEFMLSCQKL